MNKGKATNIGKIKINSIEWFVPHYTPAIPQQAILPKQMLCMTPTEFQYEERSVLLKEVNVQNLWSFE